MLDKEDHDHRLSKTEFKDYLTVVCSLLPGGEDNFDPLVEFLMTSVEVCIYPIHLTLCSDVSA